MMRNLLSVLLGLCTLVPNAYAADSESAIKHVLTAQQEAWNRHDLDSFMSGYWNSPDLTFFSGAKETRGWQATLERYRATYNSPGHAMGKLDFSEVWRWVEDYSRPYFGGGMTSRYNCRGILYAVSLVVTFRSCACSDSQTLALLAGWTKASAPTRA